MGLNRHPFVSFHFFSYSMCCWTSSSRVLGGKDIVLISRVLDSIHGQCGKQNLAFVLTTDMAMAKNDIAARKLSQHG